MALVKRNKNKVKSDIRSSTTSDEEYGRLYVIKITTKDDVVLHKVGVCNYDRSTDRMMEILRSFFMVYRYVPYAELRRDKPVRIPYIVEHHMHELLEELRYEFDKKFDGCTEFFQDVDEEKLLEYLDNFHYGLLLEGKTKMKKDRYEKICEAIRAEREAKKGKKQSKLPDDVPF